MAAGDGARLKIHRTEASAWWRVRMNSRGHASGTRNATRAAVRDIPGRGTISGAPFSTFELAFRPRAAFWFLIVFGVTWTAAPLLSDPSTRVCVEALADRLPRATVITARAAMPVPCRQSFALVAASWFRRRS